MWEKCVWAESTLTIEIVLKCLIEFTGASMEEVLPWLTPNLDIQVLDDDYNVETTFVKGKGVKKQEELLCH